MADQPTPGSEEWCAEVAERIRLSFYRSSTETAERLVREAFAAGEAKGQADRDRWKQRAEEAQAGCCERVNRKYSFSSLIQEQELLKLRAVAEAAEALRNRMGSPSMFPFNGEMVTLDAALAAYKESQA